MNDNDWALIAAILGNLSSERALALYKLRPDKNPKKDLKLTEQQALDLKVASKSTSWIKLGEVYGISGESLRMQVRKALKKTTKELAKVPIVANLKKHSILL